MHEGFATRKLYPLHAAGGSFINEPLAFFPGEFRFPGTILSPVVTMPTAIAAAFRDRPKHFREIAIHGIDGLLPIGKPLPGSRRMTKLFFQQTIQQRRIGDVLLAIALLQKLKLFLFQSLRISIITMIIRKWNLPPLSQCYVFRQYILFC